MRGRRLMSRGERRPLEFAVTGSELSSLAIPSCYRRFRMTETDSPAPSGVTVDLVAQLEAEGQFVDEGSFTLDPRKAREKLAAHQLAEPERYLLFLDEAAHLLSGCTAVAFTIRRGTMRAVFEGVVLRGIELHGCFNALFVDATSLEPEAARRVLGCQRLALALNTALRLPNRRVEMVSTIAGEGSVRAMFDADGRVRTDETPSTSRASALVVEVHSEMQLRAQLSLLRRDARYATIPVHLNGIRIDHGPSADLLTPVEVPDLAGQTIGWAGWCAVQASRGSGGHVFVANGVVVETASVPNLPVGLLAVLDASGLQRDISYTKLQRDDVYLQRVMAVEAIALRSEALSHIQPMLGPPPSTVGDLTLGVILSLFSIGLWACAVVMMVEENWSLGIWPMGAMLFVMGLGLGYWGLNLFRDIHRGRDVRRRGHAGLALIKSSTRTSLKHLGKPETWVDMLIERAGQEAYRNAGFMVVASGCEHLVDPGMRVYVRIDPNDPKFVVFDAAG
jgi:hypothetical protein